MEGGGRTLTLTLTLSLALALALALTLTLYQARITEFIGPTAESDCGAARPEPAALTRRQLDLEVARSTAAALTLSAFGEDTE